MFRFALSLLLAGPAYGASTCETRSDCVGYKGCTAATAACRCRNDKCRRKWVDCKTRGPASEYWGCQTGMLCAGDARWGTCVSVSPVEEQLGLRFLTEAEVAAAFDKHESSAVVSHGLVQYEVEGVGAGIETLGSGFLPFDSYDEFQRMCVTKCQRNAKCAAVSVQMHNSSIDWEALGVGPSDNYLCHLTADVEVRDVKASQLSASTEANDTAYVKKGRDVPTVEPCKVEIDSVDFSFSCAVCLQMPGASPELCDTQHEGFNCTALLQMPSNADFMLKILPSGGCLDTMGADPGKITACLECTREKLLELPSSYAVAGTICTEDDDLNLVRGLCKEECYTGYEACEGLIQQGSLCAAGSPLVRVADREFYGGINGPNYACP